MKRDKHTQKFSIEEILAVVYKTAGFCVCEILERIAKSDSSQLTVWLGGFEEVCSWKHFWILWEGHIIGRVWQFQAGFLTLRYTFHCGPVAALCEQRCTHCTLFGMKTFYCQLSPSQPPWQKFESNQESPIVCPLTMAVPAVITERDSAQRNHLVRTI